jgi:hypothetical protein
MELLSPRRPEMLPLSNKPICTVTVLEHPDRFQPLFTLAHLAFCAATILARPSALIFLRNGLAAGVALEPIGLPLLTCAV